MSGDDKNQSVHVLLKRMINFFVEFIGKLRVQGKRILLRFFSCYIKLIYITIYQRNNIAVQLVVLSLFFQEFEGAAATRA